MFWKKIFAKKKLSEIAEKKQTSAQETVTASAHHARKTQLSAVFLQRLYPVSLLPADELKQLEVYVEEFQPGQLIYQETEALSSLAYVVKGEVYCERANGCHYAVAANTFKALYPLSSTRINLFTAIAKTAVKIIYLPKAVLLDSSCRQEKLTIDNPQLTEQLQQTPLGQALLKNLQQRALDVPGLPDVAIRLRMAVQKDIGIAEAVKIVNLDQRIAAKLVQVVNSPLYRGVKPFASCEAAVNRLGLNTTRNLVTSFSMKALFTSKNRALTKRTQQAWQESVRVSSLCHTLAVLTHKVDPDEALLAGLTHNIGLLPIIRLADEQDKLALDDLEQCLKLAQAYIGQSVLTQWGFSESLAKIPYLIDNWFYESGEDFALVDVVILAKYHSLLGTEYMPFLPALHDLPAFQKLGDQELTPSMSLQILHDAKQQLADAMSLFEA